MALFVSIPNNIIDDVDTPIATTLPQDNEIARVLPSSDDPQFVENLGQAGEQGGALYLDGTTISIAFQRDHLRVVINPTGEEGDKSPASYLVRFDGANPVTPEGMEPTGTSYNFFLGNDPDRWTSGARGFSEVHYAGLWEGVDLVYKVVGTEIKYDLIVQPGGFPSSIRFSYEGVEDLSIDPVSGDLLIINGDSTVYDESPVSFQERGRARVPVESRFVLHGPSTVGFEIGSYDKTQPLVIDPRLIFSTLLGTDYYEYPSACFVDDEGDIYVFGSTGDDAFPMSDDAYDSSYNGNYDVFVSKMDANGSKLLYSTYIGGSNYENAMSYTNFRSEAGGIWVDDDGAVYITGNTRSNDFPTTAGAYDTTYSSYDGFVVKLSSKGDKLDFSTYIGGSSSDFPTDICVDSDGNITIVGYTYGNFPTTTGAYETSSQGNADGFATMLNASGDKLLYSTYLGDSYDDVAFAVALGPDGLTHITGSTRSSSFPTTLGAYDRSINGYNDIFVLKLDETFADLEYSTFVGSSSYDYGWDIAIDNVGNAYVAGTTANSNFPRVSGCYDTTYNGGYDAVVIKLNETGATLEASTFYGMSGNDYPMGLDLRPNGDVVIAGYTEYRVPTTSDAYSTTSQGGYDAFVATFDSNLTKLLYGSMYGSSSYDYAWDVWATGERNTTIVVGTTRYEDFPTTPGAYDTEYDYREDVFIMRIGDPYAPRWMDLKTFQAIEDVPLVINLKDKVMDLDTAVSALSLASASPYITTMKGLNVTFVFPNGMTNASIKINVSDLYMTSDALLNFTIQPVNDPPICNLTTAIFAVEKVPKIIDLGAYVWDEDTLLADLGPVYDSPYLSHDGLVLTALFPDGISSYEVLVNITDGESGTEFYLRFVVYPVDDPPSIDPLPVFNATEDVVSIFDLTPYVHDPDTPLYQLRITTTGSECTVVGQQLHFLFRSPEADHDVTIKISDVCTIIMAKLRVHVVENNDPPRVSNVPTLEFSEDTAREVDLTPYVSDEDSDLALLTLECESGACVSVDGLRLTMLYTKAVGDHRVQFTVVDEDRRTSGSFLAHVNPVNDPPVIESLNDLVPPFVITIPEDSMSWYTIHVVDEDSVSFTYLLDPTWVGLTVYQNGSLRLVATSADIGEHTVFLVIGDMDGATCREEIKVIVENVNDAPVIAKVGGRGYPFIATVDEDTEAWIEIEIVDEDSATFSFSIEPEWASIEVLQNGTLHVTVTAEDIGERSVDLQVDDLAGGVTRATIRFIVRNVNDPPEIRLIDEYEPPFVITVDEHSTTILPITVYDEEGGGIFYSLDSDWEGLIVFQNGTLRIVAGPGDTGEHTAILRVADPDGGVASMEIKVVVRDINDPPGEIFILSPADHTIVAQGTNVTFAVDVRDPDEERGQIVTVVWTSNITGKLKTLTSGSGFTFRTADLEPGTHLITITASDGLLQSEATLELTVLPPPKEDDAETQWLTGESALLLPMLLVLVILVIVTVMLVMRGRQREAEPVDGDVGPQAGTSDDSEGLKELNRSLGTAITELEESRKSEAPTAPPEWVEDTSSVQDGETSTGQGPINKDRGV